MEGRGRRDGSGGCGLGHHGSGWRGLATSPLVLARHVQATCGSLTSLNLSPRHVRSLPTTQHPQACRCRAPCP